MERSRRRLLACSAGVLIAGCGRVDPGRGGRTGRSQTATATETRTATATETASPTETPTASPTETATPARLRQPDQLLSYGERFIDERTGIAFTVDRPERRREITVDGDTVRAGDERVLVVTPVTFENTGDSAVTVTTADVFRLVTEATVVAEDDDLLGFETEEIDGLPRARSWTVQGTVFDPGESVNGTAAFQHSSPPDSDRTVVLDRRRLYRDNGDHGVISWTTV